jgi:hypothetical protein
VPTLANREGLAWSAQRIPTAVNFGFLDRSRYFSIQVVPQLSSRGWANPVPDTILLRKSGSAGNRTRDLWICSQEIWPLDYRGGHFCNKFFKFYVQSMFNICRWGWSLNVEQTFLSVFYSTVYICVYLCNVFPVSEDLEGTSEFRGVSFITPSKNSSREADKSPWHSRNTSFLKKPKGSLECSQAPPPPEPIISIHTHGHEH